MGSHNQFWKPQIRCSLLIFFLIAAASDADSRNETTYQSQFIELDILPGGLVNVCLGTPEQQLRLLINTGSATTWVVSANEEQDNEYLGVRNKYNRLNSNTSQTVKDSWRVEYGVGLVAYGSWQEDNMRLGNSIIKGLPFGEAKSLDGFIARFINFDGVLGLGSLSSPKLQQLDLVESMYEQSLIRQKVFSLKYKNNYGEDGPIGQLILGGINYDLYDNLIYVPIKWKWQIALQSIHVSSEKASTDRSSMYLDAYLDSSSNIIMLPHELVTELLLNYPMHYNDFIGMNEFDDCNYQSDHDLVIRIEHIDFIIPFKDLVILQEGYEGQYCVSAIQPGDQFILGHPFLKNYQTVFDYDNMRVGLAKPKRSQLKAKKKSKIQQDIGVVVQNLRRTITGDLYYINIGIGNQRSNLLLNTAHSTSWTMSSLNPFGLSGIQPSNKGRLIYSHLGITHPLMELDIYYDLMMYPLTFADDIQIHYPMGISSYLRGDVDAFKRLQVDGTMGLQNYIHPSHASQSLLHKLRVYEKIKRNMVSVYMKKNSRPEDESAGLVIFGGIDTKLYTGEISYVPIHNYGFNDWGLQIKEIQLDWIGTSSNQSGSSVPSARESIFSQQTQLQLVLDSKDRYFSGDKEFLDRILIDYLGASAIESINGRVTYGFVDCQLSRFQDIIFTLENNYEIRIKPEYYILNQESGTSKCRSTFLGTTRPFTFTLGTKFMEDYYLIFDYDTKQVGFAQAA